MKGDLKIRNELYTENFTGSKFHPKIDIIFIFQNLIEFSFIC